MHPNARSRRPGAPLAMAIASPLIALLLAACGSATPTASGGPNDSSAPAESGIASASVAPTEEPTPTPAPTPLGKPSADRFWELARDALLVSGHVVATGAGSPAVVLRYLPDASEALVDGDRVSICAAGKSFAGEAGKFEPIDGEWVCGAEAFVTGFRASGAPIDSWSPEFPADGTPKETVKASGGRWIWTLTGAGFDAAATTTVALDTGTGRLLTASLVDAAGTTEWTFDYETPVSPIEAP